MRLIAEQDRAFPSQRLTELDTDGQLERGRSGGWGFNIGDILYDVVHTAK
jgi:hypothetical protein